MGKYDGLERRLERLDLKMKQHNYDNQLAPYPSLMMGDKVLSQGDPVTDNRWQTPKMRGLPAVIDFRVVLPEETEIGRALMQEAKEVQLIKPAKKVIEPELNLTFEEHTAQHAARLEQEEADLFDRLDKRQGEYDAMAEKERARNAKERRIQARLEQLDTDEKPPTFGGYRRG